MSLNNIYATFFPTADSSSILMVPNCIAQKALKHNDHYAVAERLMQKRCYDNESVWKWGGGSTSHSCTHEVHEHMLVCHVVLLRPWLVLCQPFSVCLPSTQYFPSKATAKSISATQIISTLIWISFSFSGFTWFKALNVVKCLMALFHWYKETNIFLLQIKSPIPETYPSCHGAA